MRVLKSLAALAAFALTGAAAPDRYAVGQVWEYRTRPGDEGSLLRIQAVEDGPEKIGRIYHVSVIGFHLRNPDVLPVLQHAPVARQTLDDSVTRLSASPVQFPDAGPGIDEWRRAKGGVYTITVAEIVDALDATLSAPIDAEEAVPTA